MLLTTEGFTDVYHIARATRRDLFNVHYHKRAPLIRLRDAFGVAERTDSTGTVRRAVDEATVRLLAAKARDDGYEAIAVCFLFGYLNPSNELRARDVILEEWPEAIVSISGEVAPEWREYERTSSTVMDAYISPVIRRYLDRFESRMRAAGVAAPLNVMQSNGGIMSARRAAGVPLQTLMSGPVGGTIAGESLASSLGRDQLICVDMGGTSFDVSLVVEGRAKIVSEAHIEGLPMLIPVVDLHTVGAGGGSIARAVAGGVRVGPESAGSAPGPASYGRGGTEPTVTDANVVLGRVSPEGFAGGTMTLDATAADAAVDALADALGMQRTQIAEGICTVANSAMANAIRRITIEQGIAPRDFSLVAFGGAGPMHAVFLARELDIPEVIIPEFPGVLSAWGMLRAGYRVDRVAPLFSSVAKLSPAHLADVIDRTSRTAAAEAREERGDDEGLEVDVLVEARYVGQEFTTPIRYDAQSRAEEFVATLAGRFHAAHRARFGHANEREAVEITSVRAVATLPAGSGRTVAAERPDGAEEVRVRDAVFDGEPVPTHVRRRRSLPTGVDIPGPLIIEEETTTSVIPPGCTVSVHPTGALVVRVGIAQNTSMSHSDIAPRRRSE